MPRTQVKIMGSEFIVSSVVVPHDDSTVLARMLVTPGVPNPKQPNVSVVVRMQNGAKDGAPRYDAFVLLDEFERNPSANQDGDRITDALEQQTVRELLAPSAVGDASFARRVDSLVSRLAGPRLRARA